jgi:hypothetical protein
MSNQERRNPQENSQEASVRLDLDMGIEDVEEPTMEDRLRKISSWAARGTLGQFRTEVEVNLEGTDYTVETQGNKLLFYRVQRQGGLFGIGAKTVKEPVLEITRSDLGIEIPDEPQDPEFVRFLAGELEQH